jgi:hypothetical protein
LIEKCFNESLPHNIKNPEFLNCRRNCDFKKDVTDLTKAVRLPTLASANSLR